MPHRIDIALQLIYDRSSSDIRHLGGMHLTRIKGICHLPNISQLFLLWGWLVVGNLVFRVKMEDLSAHRSISLLRDYPHKVQIIFFCGKNINRGYTKHQLPQDAPKNSTYI